MKHAQLVTLYPCPQCRLEFVRDELYTCWRVRCKEHGIVMDHGSLTYGAKRLAIHRKEDGLCDTEPSNCKQSPKV